jgi:glycosyltransferase involved in cell wall biosynthesis
MSTNISSKVIVVSAINFFQGGPLSILKDCLEELTCVEYSKFKIIVLVHKKSLFLDKTYPDNIQFREYPESRKSYAHRFLYEYYFFGKESKKMNVYLWLSLHDMSPRNIKAEVKAVYCHNPTPFYKKKWSDIIYLNLFFSTWFYKYIYKFNIHSNDFVIVQQQWIKDAFIHLFGLTPERFIVAKPSVPTIDNSYITLKNEVLVRPKKTFFYPSFPRPFKNIEVIGEAISLLPERLNDNFEVIFTIDGSENKYAAKMVERYRSSKAMRFVGVLARDEVYSYYAHADCLIFPSKLETWGLPISEFRQFKKPMLVSNLPYAKESCEGYDLVKYFNPEDAKSLALIMEQIIDDSEVQYDYYSLKPTEKGIKTESWKELFTKLLNGNA